jgi:hypothetical protein
VVRGWGVGVAAHSQILLDFLYGLIIIEASGLPVIALEGAGLDHAVSSAPFLVPYHTGIHFETLYAALQTKQPQLSVVVLPPDMRYTLAMGSVKKKNAKKKKQVYRYKTPN